MQIKLTDGTIHQVAQAEIQRAYKSVNRDASKHEDAQEDNEWLADIIEKVHKSVLEEHNEAAQNIKRVAQMQQVPATCEAVKDALIEVLMYGPIWDQAEMIFQTSRWMATKQDHCMLKKALEVL